MERIGLAPGGVDLVTPEPHRHRTLRILLVEDNNADAELIRRCITKAIDSDDYYEVHCRSLSEALNQRHSHFDVVLTDLNLPDSYGASTVARLAAQYGGTPIIALTIDEELGVECIRAGAQDFMPKDDLHPRSLARAIEFAIQRNQKTHQLEFMSRHDALTGLLNRWAFEEGVRQLVYDSTHAAAIGMAALIIDINKFKAINDTYGHAVGDAVLKAVATRLQLALRAEDLVCRWGGDEFAVVARAPSQSVVDELASRIKDCVTLTLEMPSDDGDGRVDPTKVSVMASVGKSFSPMGEAFTVEELIEQADASMYSYKHVPVARDGVVDDH